MRMSRFAIQAAALATLLLLPLLSRGSALYQAYGKGATHINELATPWDAFLFHAFSQVAGWFQDPVAIADQFQGGFWSITLFGVTFTDPLALAGHLLASGGIHWPLIVGIAAPVVLAILAGRVFCGWICPVNTLLELNGRLRDWIERRVALQRLPRFVLPGWSRWAVLLGTVGLAGTAGYNAFAFVLPYAGIARDWHFVVYGTGVGFGLLFIVVLVALELLIAPRLWCRSLCPTGLLLETLGRRRVFGIRKSDQPACPSGCHACVAACPVGVIPRDGILTESCLMCSACTTRCPTNVLSLGPTATDHRRPWRLATGALVLFILLGISGSAAAHHIKGQPHYGYLENYPQTPTREQRFTAPPYLITLVAFEFDGLKAARSETPNDVMIYVSARHQETRKGYRGPLTVTFRDTSGGDTITRRFKFPVEETVYRARVTLPASAYDVGVHLTDADVEATTRLDIRGVALSVPLFFVGGVVIVLLVIIGLLGLRHRRRRARVDLAEAAH